MGHHGQYNRPGSFSLGTSTEKAGHVERLQDIVRTSRSITCDAYSEVIAGTVSFLASQDVSFITGQTLRVEGGALFV